MKRLTAYLSLFALLALTIFTLPSFSQGTRVFNVPRPPIRLLKKQFAGNTNVFTKVDPTAGGTPLTLTSATGRSRMDGSVALCLMAGFTPPITLTVFYWQRDEVTQSKTGWVRLGSNALQYQTSVDSRYVLVNFAIPENTPFIVMASANDTGDVYTDAPEDPNNANTVAGYPTK